MKKNINTRLLITFYIIIPALLLFINYYPKIALFKNESHITLSKSVVNPINEKIIYIEICKGPMIKQITNKDDINKIVNFLNSIKYKDANSMPNGAWNYIIRLQTSIKDSNKKNISIALFDNKIQYINGNYYELDEKTFHDFKQIYSKMKYREVRWTDLKN